MPWLIPKWYWLLYHKNYNNRSDLDSFFFEVGSVSGFSWWPDPVFIESRIRIRFFEVRSRSGFLSPGSATLLMTGAQSGELSAIYMKGIHHRAAVLYSQGCGSGWILPGSDLWEKKRIRIREARRRKNRNSIQPSNGKPDPDPTFEKRQFRIRPSRKLTRIWLREEKYLIRIRPSKRQPDPDAVF